MTHLAPLITNFLRDYMPRQRGYSPRTCETYAVSFRLLLRYAAERTATRPSRLSIEQLDAPLIVDFLAHIERERGNGARTRNLRLAAIKAFMRYVEHHVPAALAQIGQIEAIPVKRHEQKLARHRPMEEVRSILNTPDLTTRAGVRDRAMIHLCFAGGLRVSELIGVLIENVTLGQLPPTLEGDRARPQGVAERAWAGARTRTVRQCRRRGTDARRLRIRTGQACPNSGGDMRVAPRPLGLAAPTST